MKNSGSARESRRMNFHAGHLAPLGIEIVGRIVAELEYQCFRQNLGSHLITGAVVTQRFGGRAGWIHAALSRSLVSKTIQAVLVATASLATGQGQGERWRVGRAAGVPCGTAHRAQAARAMAAQRAGRARLPVTHAGAGCGGAAAPLQLAARCVRASARRGLAGTVGAPQQRRAPRRRVAHHHPLAVPWQRPLVDALRVPGEVLRLRRDRGPARQRAPLDLPSVSLRPSWALTPWSAGEGAEMGLPSARPDDRPGPSAEAIPTRLWAARALDGTGGQPCHVRCGHAGGTVRPRGLEAGRLGGVGRPWRGGFPPEDGGAGVRPSAPGARGPLQALVSAARRPMPAHGEARGLLAALRDNPRSACAERGVPGGDALGTRRIVPADPIHVARTPPGQRWRMRGPGATQRAERHAAWHHQPAIQPVTEQGLLRLLGVLHAPSSTRTPLHGLGSMQMEGETHPAWMTIRVATSLSTKTVRSIESRHAESKW